MITLGLDASTTTVGWSFSENKTVLDAGFIDISKFDSNKDKSNCVISTLNNNINIKNVNTINLEAALSGFAGGFTSQQVIIKLSRFNAIFEYIITEHWKLPVNLISVNTARKQLFGKCRIKGVDSKSFVKSELEKMMNISKWDKVTSRNNWDKRNSDTYDAIVISLYNK